MVRVGDSHAILIQTYMYPDIDRTHWLTDRPTNNKQSIEEKERKNYKRVKGWKKMAASVEVKGAACSSASISLFQNEIREGKAGRTNIQVSQTHCNRS